MGSPSAQEELELCLCVSVYLWS